MSLLACPIAEKDWALEIGARNGVTRHAQEAKVKAAADAGPWEPAVQEIISYQHLRDNWDSGGAKAPTRELLESAIGLAYCFLERSVPPPTRVVPGVDGSVVFEWQSHDGSYSEVEVVRPFFAEVMLIEPGKPAQHWTLPTE